ncbi:MAG: phospholipase effector Tle1 domain-containing protein, partial [Chthoniobacterales bacterium]
MALYAFDGTWNKPDIDKDNVDKNTNVYNFLAFYAPGDPEAQAKREDYKAGVGTRFGEPGRIVGGLFGAGGRDRVHELVQAFAANWKHNGPEDRIVDVIGFSRGAALALHFTNALASGVNIDGQTVKPSIRFLGLWDVVPSFGLPGTVLTEAHEINIGWHLDVPSTVEHCYHAMALDERREAFDVHRLDPEEDDWPRIQEWWFRGVHSD